VDSLMITHMDMLPRLGEWKYSQGYVNGQSLLPSIFQAEVSDGVLKNFHFPKSPSIETQSQLTQALFQITPMIEACDADEETAIQKIELLTKCSVKMVSRGPSAKDVQVLKSFPS
jgi:adenylosuccinate synthase